MNRRGGESIDIMSGSPLKNGKKSGSILSALAKQFFNLPIISSLWDKKNSPSKNINNALKKKTL